MLKVTNTLNGKKEEFIPLDPSHIKMYVCGPTVYSRPHIGNMRSVVVYDVIYRFLKHLFPRVTYVRNITDVDDKILNAAAELKCDPIDLTKLITAMFNEDCVYLGCLSPDIEPRATQEIDKMIEIIDSLIKNGFAYISEKHVLFDIQKYEKYGELSNRNIDELIAGSRVDVESYKKNPGDFVLWKPVGKDDLGWETKFGYGRPGWHIECSAMSVKYLGADFDIHGGGADLQFPHHENEIAQSKCGNLGSSFAKYWIHNGFLTVNGEKMSKSLGNFTTCEDLRGRGFNGEVVRFGLMSTHYHKPIDFTDMLLSNSKQSLQKFYDVLQGNEFDKECAVPTNAVDCLKDDFNIAKYIALMFSYYNDIRSTLHIPSKRKLISEFYAMGKLIGLFFNDSLINEKCSDVQVDVELQKMIDDRKRAKEGRDYSKADEIRHKIELMGYIIEDNKDGTVKITTK